MKIFCLLLACLFFLSQQTYAKKEELPKEEGWNQKGERTNSSPQLYQDDTYVYVYSERQLDYLYIGITDTLGNVFYEETTTVPADQYYAIPISSLPDGTYYFSIIQGSNYVIGIFSK